MDCFRPLWRAFPAGLARLRRAQGLAPQRRPECTALGVRERTAEAGAERGDAMTGERAPRLRLGGARTERKIGPGPHGLFRHGQNHVVHRTVDTLATMRVVSLVPAAPELVWALGATDHAVAVPHADAVPPA